MRRLLLSLLVLSLMASGCSRESAGDPRALELPDAPFLAGSPKQYRQPGVYAGLRRSHGVFVSSNDTMVVALSAACPHDGCGVVYESMANQFKCPCCARRYTPMGLAKGTPPGDPLAMKRLHISLTSDGADPDAKLRIDPTVTYTQEKNQWSYRYSLHLFEPRQ